MRIKETNQNGWLTVNIRTGTIPDHWKSEVMSESLGHATVNQQHYLDLGYTDSVAQTRAALIAGAELPVAKSIQLGKQATKRLLENKWGFFSRNGSENLSPAAQLNQALQRNRTYEQLENISAKNPNAYKALSSKLSRLERIQLLADKIETMPDGSVRYYDKFRAAQKSGPTVGSRFVTEFNPKTGDVTMWNEVYNSSGQVNRIHLKNINGIEINSPHFRQTLQEILEQKKMNRPF